MKRWLIALLVLTLAVGSLAFVAYAQQKDTGKVKMIMIRSDTITPKTATIDKGTTVIWVNTTSGGVNIFFSKGREIEAVCAAPSRFALDNEQKYNSGDIPQGGTASVCFLEAGKYEYDVARSKTAGGATKGTIIVRMTAGQQ